MYIKIILCCLLSATSLITTVATIFSTEETAGINMKSTVQIMKNEIKAELKDELITLIEATVRKILNDKPATINVSLKDEALLKGNADEEKLMDSTNANLGTGAGANFQQQYAVAVGNDAGSYTQGLYTVAVGTEAGKTSQGYFAVAVGNTAGKTQQGTVAVAVGMGAGYEYQGEYSVAVGHVAGYSRQGKYSVAVGYQSGSISQADNSVAVGLFAGYQSQHTKTIILNASGAALNSAQSGSFFVKPIRGVPSFAVGIFPLQYNSATGEISYNTASASKPSAKPIAKPPTRKPTK